ncbi:hypothetical protein GQ457_02G042710 [Hibiscus cannabinus]
MVSQTQQELQRVKSNVQQFQTDLHQVETTVANRFSQVERTIEGTISSVLVEIRDELAVFKNDVQSQISSLESMIRNFFEQPRVPTGVTTESLASSTIIVVIPPSMVIVDMLPKISPPLLDEGDFLASLEMEIQKSTARSLHDVYHTMGLETSLCDPVWGKAPVFVVGSSYGFEVGREKYLDNLYRGLLGSMPSVRCGLTFGVPTRFGSKVDQGVEPVQTLCNHKPVQTGSTRSVQDSDNFNGRFIFFYHGGI